MCEVFNIFGIIGSLHIVMLCPALLQKLHFERAEKDELNELVGYIFTTWRFCFIQIVSILVFSIKNLKINF